MVQSLWSELSTASTEIGNCGIGFIQEVAALEQDPDELVSKQALCRLFECSGRTIQRMVERRVLPPPLTMDGRKYWQAGTLGKWLAEAGKCKQAELEAEAGRLRSMMSDRWCG